MSEQTASLHAHTTGSTVRLSRVVRLSWAVALGCSVTIGLGIFVSLGPYVALTARRAAPAYLLLPLLSAPFVLTYWERAVSLPGTGGAYQISRSSGILWHRYFSGWLLLGGYVTVVALLSWGMGLYLGAALALFGVELEVDLRLLAYAGLGLSVLFTMMSQVLNWRRRVAIIFASTAFLLLVSILGVLDPSNSGQRVTYLAPSVSMLGVVALMMSSLWGILLVMGVRARLERPTQNMAWALALPVALCSVVGALAALAVSLYGRSMVFPDLPLLDIVATFELLPEGPVTLTFIALALAINLLAANHCLIAGRRLLEEMVDDGFLPQVLQRLNGMDGPAAAAVWLGVLPLLGLAVSIPTPTLLALCAALFLWSAALIHLPDVFRSQPTLPPKRPIRLPFHPLFPGLTVASGVLLSFALPPVSLVYAAIWTVIGGAYYGIYARSRGLSSRRQLTVVEEAEAEAAVDSDDGMTAGEPYTVLVGINEYGTASARLRLAAKLAAAHGGQVLALKIVDLPEYGNQIGWQKVAQREWQELAENFSQEDFGGVPVRPVVRLASSLAEGILQTVREERAQWLLIGWPDELAEDRDGADDHILNEIVAYAECNVGILRGIPPDDLTKIVVATAGGGNDAAGLQLAMAVVRATGKIHLVHVIRGVSAPELTEEAEDVLDRVAADAHAATNLYTSVINAPTVDGGVGARYRGADLLVVGASKYYMPERSYFGGLGRELVEQDARPALLVRRTESERFRTLRRAGTRFADLLPALTPERRTEVRRQMRSSALPTVDFFVLIVLSSIIATLGLLQNSAAVIIGAMLVAPLMSPILAIGMGMTVGEARTMQNGLESTLKGLVMAVVVGAVVVIISPIEEPTNEILARTSPNILDLMVALASGAAAGYAICRKEVAAALPGVAIAAALVPPLCVVGYGIGVSQLDISAGALLLFVTNLIAIIFAAAMTFLALGFHPPRAARGELIRTLRLTIISLVAIAAVLVLATVATVRQEDVRRKVDETFSRFLDANSARVIEVSVQRRGDAHLITATAVRFPGSDLTPDDFIEMQDALEAAVGTSVEMDVTLLDGWKDNFVNIDKRVSLTDSFTQAIIDEGASVQEATTRYETDHYTIVSTVLVFDGHTLTAEGMQALQDELAVSVGAPVVLEMTFLQALQAELGISTPTPSP